MKFLKIVSKIILIMVLFILLLILFRVEFPPNTSLSQKIEILTTGNTNVKIGPIPDVDQIRMSVSTEDELNDYDIKYNFITNQLKIHHQRNASMSLENCAVNAETALKLKNIFKGGTLCEQAPLKFKKDMRVFCEMDLNPEFFLENESQNISVGYFKPGCNTDGAFLCGNKDDELFEVIKIMLSEISVSCLNGMPLILPLKL